MPETTNNFRNIISVVAEANSAQTALMDMYNTLRGIQVAAREAGMVLDQLLAKQAAVAQAGAGATTAAPRNIWQKLRDITMGGEEVTGAGSGVRPGYYEQLARDKGANEATIARMQADIAARSARTSVTSGIPAQIQAGPIATPGMNPDVAAQIQAALAQGGGQIADPAIAAQFSKITSGAQEATAAVQGTGRAVTNTGRSFTTTATNIVTSMFVWQGVNIAANTLINTFTTLKDNYLAVDGAAAKLSVTMGMGRDAARGYAQGVVAQGAQYGIGTQESMAAGSFAARVQKAPEQRKELFDISAMLSVRTGEDQLKLMDNLNVASRQSGLSIARAGDMAEAAYNKTGTSATQALDIIRELGPIAQASGVNIQTLFETVIKSADRMGGSAADATNTWTRLWKAVTEPNQAQLDVLNKYKIPLSGDVNTKIGQITRAGLTPEEMGVMSGRPGMPAAANDMRTMFEVMKTLDGELDRGPGLANDYEKSIDSLDFSFKRFFATIQSNMGMSIGVIEKALSGGNVQEKMLRLYGYDEATIAKMKDAQAKINNAAMGRDGLGAIGLAPKSGPGSRGAAWFGSTATTGPIREKETNYEEYLARLPERNEGRYAAAGQRFGLPQPPAHTGPTGPAWETGVSEIRNKILAGLELASPTDLSRYTGAEIGGIGGKGKEKEKEWLDSLSKFYDDMKITGDDKNKAMEAARKAIDEFVGVFKTPQGISIEYGAEAYYKQQNLAQQSELLNKAPMTGTDISQYTDAEVQRALSEIPAIQAGIMASWRRFYQQMGLSPEEVDEMLAAKAEMVQSTVAAFQSGSNMTIASGATAAYLPQALQKAGREQALEDRLKELRESMDELNETTKKSQKLEGLWNIPVGARILAPFAGKALEPEGPDTSDEAIRQRRMEKLKEDERKIMEELERIRNPQAATLVPASAPQIARPEPVREDPMQRIRDREARLEKQELDYKTRAPSAAATLDVQGFNAAVGKFSIAMSKTSSFSDGLKPDPALHEPLGPAAASSDTINTMAAAASLQSSSAATFKEGVSSFGSAANSLGSLGTYVGMFGTAVDRLLIGIGNIVQNATSQPAAGGPTGPSSFSVSKESLYSQMAPDLINQARVQGVFSQ